MRLVYVFDYNTSAPEYVLRVPKFCASLVIAVANKCGKTWDWWFNVEGDI